jgi:UDP:flavonoid glycosyltransferase YjiC (YdhE family)
MRILVTSTPGMGHLSALLPLMFALQDAGHDLLAVTAAESCKFVEGYGFEVRKGGLSSNERRATLAPRMPEILALPPRRRRGHYYAGFFAEGAAPVMRVALRPVFDDFRPDIVIHETGELAGGPMAVARGLPHMTVAFSGALPEWGEELALTALAPLWMAEGLPAPTMDDVRGDLYLHPFPPSFGQAPSSGVVLPMRAEGVDRDAGSPPPWLDDLGARRPLVYATSGTEPAAGMAPWAAIVAALGSIDVDAVVTIGKHVDPSLLGEVPRNIRVERFVPQRFVLDRASVVISHAGAGSLLGAARRGIPQLLSPLVADQWENADAATSAGIAITCELDQRSDTEIGAAVARLLNDDQFRQVAAKVADEIEAMPTPADLVATIEALVGDD